MQRLIRWNRCPRDVSHFNLREHPLLRLIITWLRFNEFKKVRHYITRKIAMPRQSVYSPRRKRKTDNIREIRDTGNLIR